MKYRSADTSRHRKMCTKLVLSFPDFMSFIHKLQEISYPLAKKHASSFLIHQQIARLVKTSFLVNVLHSKIRQIQHVAIQRNECDTVADLSKKWKKCQKVE